MILSRARGFLPECEEQLAKTVFFNTAELLDLSLDLVFLDGSSTYWETDQADQAASLRPPLVILILVQMEDGWISANRS